MINLGASQVIDNPLNQSKKLSVFSPRQLFSMAEKSLYEVSFRAANNFLPPAPLFATVALYSSTTFGETRS